MNAISHSGRPQLISARISLCALLGCFVLPFFTFTFSTSACSGDRSHTELRVSGVDLVRGTHAQVSHTGPPSELGDAQVLDSASFGQGAAVALLVVALAGLVVTLPRLRAYGWPLVLLSLGAVWALLVLNAKVSEPAVDISYEPGYWVALISSLCAAAASIGLLYALSRRPAGALRGDGFWRRLVGWLIDALLIALVCVPAGVLAASAGAGAGAVLLLVIVIAVAYPAGCELTGGSTIGGRISGTRVTRPDGSSIGAGRAVLRTLAEPICLVGTLGAGHLLAGLTPEKRALHDVLTGTRVVRRPVADPARETEAEGEGVA